MQTQAYWTKNYKWIYTYDYAPDSVWDEWRTNVGAPEWIEKEASDVAARVHKELPCFVLLSDSHFAYNGTWDDTVHSLTAVRDKINKNSEGEDKENPPLKGIIHLGDMSDEIMGA